MNTQIKLINNYFLGIVAILLFFAGNGQLCGQSIAAVNITGAGEELPLDYQYYDLACNVDAWEGYFAPDRWKRTVVKVEPFPFDADPVFFLVAIHQLLMNQCHKCMAILGPSKPQFQIMLLVDMSMVNDTLDSIAAGD